MKLLYETPSEFVAAPEKRIAFFGMSGLGKSYISDILRKEGSWFHYSVDYRIGTAYMGEHIADNLKVHAMKDPLLEQLLRTDSIYIGSNITFDNLAPLSTFLGKPGDPAKGGLTIEEYKRRQELHRRAEINALLDTEPFIRRAQGLYGYPNFVCDTGGSICEVVDPEDPADDVLTTLGRNCLMIWLESPEGHDDELIRRFKAAPKPIYYPRETLETIWNTYLEETGLTADAVDPDAFAVHAFAKVIHRRAPRYAAMARNWGISLTPSDLYSLRDSADIEAAIARALGNHGASS